VLVGHIETSTPVSLKKIMCFVGAKLTPINFILDLGAKVSIISRRIYEEHLSTVKLSPSKSV